MIRILCAAVLLVQALQAAPPASRTPRPAVQAARSAPARLAALEARAGGRLGVAALDTGTGRRIAHRGEERFPMCSTFKVLLAGAVLARVEKGQERLDRPIAYTKSDLLEYAPVAAARLAEGRMTVEALCAAAVEASDNTAANLLLQALGGPGEVTAFARGLGDPVTRLDRTEPTLNTALPGDPRDTTTPAAMVESLKAMLLGGGLEPDSCQRLEGWMRGSLTGGDRLRAGLPATWTIGDKTGTGDRGTVNDVAILRPPGRAPILVAAYYTGSRAPLKDRNAVLAEVGRIVAAAFQE
ncbi:class A beta-lactamase [Geothrix fermentans]|uniref:class A beta-lactamase n=1 Tax=Geothrix fermentans TaxID=44676 RepID=UPI000411D01D|nr:class A beta-lactamase [Geothrix fermentans]